MRTAAVQVVFSALLICSGLLLGADLAEHEKTCAELGFKKRTAAYGECVLELDRRETDQVRQAVIARAAEQLRQQDQQEKQAALQRQQQEQERAAQIAARGDGTPDHQTCNRFGFVAGTPPYSDCRLRIDIARKEEAQRQTAFEAEERRFAQEKRQYDERVAAYEKERERQKGLALMRFGAALMSGTSPYSSENFANAGRASLGMAPVPPTRPQIQNFTITGPSGRMTNCTAVNNNINCF
jgi:hypothetical protein